MRNYHINDLDEIIIQAIERFPEQEIVRQSIHARLEIEPPAGLTTYNHWRDWLSTLPGDSDKPIPTRDRQVWFDSHMVSTLKRNSEFHIHAIMESQLPFSLMATVVMSALAVEQFCEGAGCKALLSAIKEMIKFRAGLKDEATIIRRFAPVLAAMEKSESQVNVMTPADLEDPEQVAPLDPEYLKEVEVVRVIFQLKRRQLLFNIDQVASESATLFPVADVEKLKQRISDMVGL